MSFIGLVKIVCPKCGKEEKICVDGSRAGVLNYQQNRKCPYCGFEGRVMGDGKDECSPPSR